MTSTSSPIEHPDKTAIIIDTLTRDLSKALSDYQDLEDELIELKMKNRELVQSAADPTVFAVSESDVAAVIVSQNETNWMADGSFWGRHLTADDMRNKVESYIWRAAACEAVARAIEAEQSTDPVTIKAQELWSVVHDGDGVDWIQAVAEVKQRYYRLARHVLGVEGES